jgi:hypothetical protein
MKPSSTEVRTPVKPSRLESDRFNVAWHNPLKGQTQTTPAKVDSCNRSVNNETPSRQRATVFFDTADGGQLIVSYDAPGQQVRPSPQEESLFFRHGFSGRRENVSGPKSGCSRLSSASDASSSLADTPCLTNANNNDSVSRDTRYFSDDIDSVSQDPDQFELDQAKPAVTLVKTLDDSSKAVPSSEKDVAVNRSGMTPLYDKRLPAENLDADRLSKDSVKHEVAPGREKPVCRGHEKPSDLDNSDTVDKFAICRSQASKHDLFQSKTVSNRTDAEARKCAKDTVCFKTPLQPAKTSRSAAVDRRLSSTGCESSGESRRTMPFVDRTTTSSYKHGRMSDIGTSMKTSKAASAVANKFSGAESHTRPVAAASIRSSVSSATNKQVLFHGRIYSTYLLSCFRLS